ncbi:MAG: polyprenyl synthetase family protein, partial [Pseudomonadota bacterium]
MDTMTRIDRALEAALTRAAAGDAPRRLCAALRHALFPGGARVRPQLALAVARACGDDRPALSDAAGVAIELMHCASLVHDDLPCFDDADTRRGKATVHCAFGEPLALLAGDAMIVMAFEVLAHASAAAGAEAPHRLAALIGSLSRATGLPGGIVAGQAWESEPEIRLGPYHRAKTGALFVAATRMGALAAGADPTPWRTLGDRLGEAYQVADDLRDALCTPEELGKPAGQDDLHDRPNAVTRLGIGGAVARLEALLGEASASIPACRGEEELRMLVQIQAKRLTPRRA